MTLPYPDRLLPKAHYHYIEDFQSLNGHYLQRWMPANWEVTYDDGEPIISGETIPIASGHIADFSTNLIGVFMPEDRFFQFTERGLIKYGSLFVLPEDIDPPIRGEDYRHAPTLKQFC